MHVGHGLGLEHDLGLGVAQAISLVGITSPTLCNIHHIQTLQVYHTHSDEYHPKRLFIALANA